MGDAFRGSSIYANYEKFWEKWVFSLLWFLIINIMSINMTMGSFIFIQVLSSTLSDSWETNNSTFWKSSKASVSFVRSPKKSLHLSSFFLFLGGPVGSSTIKKNTTYTTIFNTSYIFSRKETSNVTDSKNTLNNVSRSKMLNSFPLEQLFASKESPLMMKKID